MNARSFCTGIARYFFGVTRSVEYLDGVLWGRVESVDRPPSEAAFEWTQYLREVV